jgi:putative ABC transport system permease protein
MSRAFLLSLLRNLLRRDKVERELDEEVRNYVDLLADEKAAAGLPEHAAYQAARAEVGGLEQIKEDVRDQRAGAVAERLLQDVRFGFRMAIRNPMFAAVVILTLGIGIGATTAVFSVVDAVLLNPLPFPRANRIMTLWQRDRNATNGNDDVAPANFLAWRDEAHVFEAMAAIEPSGLDFVSEGEPQNLRIWRVSEGFFEILGVQPLHGRTFTADEYRPGGRGAVVLSYGFWQERFGGSTDVAGRTLTLSGRPYVVAGIMPRQFDFPPGRALWAPRSFTEKDRQSQGTYLNVVALLKPGIGTEAAENNVRSVADRLSRQSPSTNRNVDVAIVPLRDQLIGHVRPFLFLMSGAVVLVLLIACVNVANVLLARGAARHTELAVRAALGAGPKRLFSQLLVENLAVAVLGGVLGAIVARWGVKTLVALAPGDVPRLQEAGINGTVLAFAIALSCVTALLFSILPARHFSRIKTEGTLREGPRGGSRAVTDRTRRALVIGEVALAVTLLTGASLLMRSFSNLLRVDPGFSAENVAALPVFVWSQYPTEAQRAVFFQQTLQKIEAVPGVIAAGAATAIPFSEVLADTRTRLTILGRPTPDEARPTIGVNVATPGYFRAMGMTIIRGRGFGSLDRRGAQPVVLINETMARSFWPDGSPLGQRIRITDGPPAEWEIVGIVRDTRDSGLDATPTSTVFLPHEQHSVGTMTYVVRTGSDPGSVVNAVKAAVWSVNKQLSFRQITMLRQLVATSIAPRQFVMVLMGVFGVVGLFLAAVGIFGIINYLVARQTQEIGLRIALGAQPQNMVYAIVGEGVRLAGIGAAIGLVGAAVTTQLLSGFLFEVGPTDPIAYAGAIMVVLIVAAVASYMPARQAASLSPMLALRIQ